MTHQLKTKKIILCSGEKVAHYTIPGWMQMGLLILFVWAGFWIFQTSFLYFYGNELVAVRDQQVSALTKQRDALQKELAVYQARAQDAEKLASDIQQSHQDILDKVDVLVSEEIKNTQGTLNKVEKVLKDNGTPISKLLKKVQKENVGGPLVPDMTSALLQSPFAQKLNDVYDKLDYLESLITLTDTMPMSCPVSEMRVTAAFGRRQDPFTGQPARHEGIDLAGVVKAPVHATAPGVVKRAFTNGAYGEFVEIEHEAGFMTRYAHLSKILVQKGDAIQTGDVIGLVGDTGRSTGPHLHYEVLLGGKPLNPYRFIKTQRGSKNV